mgnify:CR=1 FL=1|jgi:hypothetical protein
MNMEFPSLLKFSATIISSLFLYKSWLLEIKCFSLYKEELK